MHGLLWEEVRTGRLSLPHDAEVVLAKLQLQTRAHHERLWQSLERAIDRYESADLEVATAKGVTAEARWYPSMGARPSVDVDLLLKPSDILRASEAVAMTDPGHRLRASVTSLATAGHLQSVDLRDESNSHIDLHFDILKYEVATRQSQLIWDRTQFLTTPNGRQVRVLDAETSLILFLLHLNKDRFSYLLGFADVVRLVEQEDLDWELIDHFLRVEGLETHCYLALDTVFESLGLTAPGHPLPSGWRASGWKRLWPESVLLRGNLGLVSHRRRQYWIGATARGRSTEAAWRWARRVFPNRVLLDYYHPGVSGPYLWRLLRGRLKAANEHRQVAARYESPT